MNNAEDTMRSGGCLCGAVRYHVRGQPLRVGICHCTDCRKSSGSVYSAYAIWPRASLEMTGEVGTYSGRSFCPACGGRVVSMSEAEAEVMMGSMDHAPTDLIPSYELWIGRREDWLLPLPWATQFSHDRVDEKSDA